jgi:hypothetical protein
MKRSLIAVLAMSAAVVSAPAFAADTLNGAGGTAIYPVL